MEMWCQLKLEAKVCIKKMVQFESVSESFSALRSGLFEDVEPKQQNFSFFKVTGFIRSIVSPCSFNSRSVIFSDFFHCLTPIVKASYTFVEFLAEVSMYDVILNSWHSFTKSSSLTCRSWSNKSFLLPTTMNAKLSGLMSAYLMNSSLHWRMFLKLDLSFMA